MIKTHKKSGITGYLKINVGINGRMDWHSHHRKGSLSDGGDEYLNKSLLKKLLSILDKFESLMHNYSKLKNIYYINSFFRGLIIILIKKVDRDLFLYGNWWKNNTICRTILDLNKILCRLFIHKLKKKLFFKKSYNLSPIRYNTNFFILKSQVIN